MQLPLLDIIVMLIYLAGVVAFGCWFVRRTGDKDHFVAAGGSLPGWAVGLSIFGTYLSSNTFLGVPGKAYGSNWNAFVFSLSLPIAAFIAVKYFVPFYRNSKQISAYHHLEERFGPWARSYGVGCYLLTQIARMASILFGVALGLSALTGWDLHWIIIATGVLVTFYTLMGGIEAVIWTDVVQSVVLMAGAIAILIVAMSTMPVALPEAYGFANEAGKFSLGEASLDFTQPTILVVFLFGIFINLTNFGIDQSFVQRYHTASSEAAAGRSVWFGALLYIPIAGLFFFIGTTLFAYYQHDSTSLNSLKQEIAERKLGERNVEATSIAIEEEMATLKHSDLGDKVLPHFIVNKLPPGIAGLLIAAIFAAAMSSIDTSLNSSATVSLEDIWRRYVFPIAPHNNDLHVLYGATIIWGLIGTGAGLAMIGVKSVLDAWWMLSGVFAGGQLGLFLLGFTSKRVGSMAAGFAVIIGTPLILWLTLSTNSDYWPKEWSAYQSPLHGNMVVVIGTITIIVLGAALSILLPKR